MIHPKYAALILMSLATTISYANDFGGQTANGCTYKVINGEYIYNCAAKQAPSSAPTPSAIAAAPPTMNFVIAPPTNQGQSVGNDNDAGLRSEKRYNKSSSSRRDRFYDATYIGVSAGSSTITSANAGSALGAGLSIGTNLDDFLGIELAYSYTKQDILLGLAGRSGGSSNATVLNSGLNAPTKDSSVTAHLLSAEIQFHLTDTYKRLRPYGGLGLGWKQSTLEETGSTQNYAYYGATNLNVGKASLSQSSLGAVGSLGTKFRFSDAWQGVVAFRYFLPASSQTASLKNASSGKLNLSDTDITDSSIYQLSGGLQYAF